jgi:soluble lytic murein transglycosylase-like protein
MVSGIFTTVLAVRHLCRLVGKKNRLVARKLLLQPQLNFRVSMKRLPIQVAAGAFCAVVAGALHASEWDGHLVALEAAAAGGEPKALSELAAKYEHAEGVTRDLLKANKLYCQAAKQGYPEAQFRLGWIYANGRGVPRDDALAAAFLAMAADGGHEYAAKLLEHIPRQQTVQLPSCMLPDPPPEVATAPVEPDIVIAGRPEIVQLVRRLAPQYSVDFRLALALISVESGFNAAAVSPKRAQGLMQLIPETAERFGVKKAFDPVENIKGGLAYLRWLLAFFQGDVRLVLAGYNAGERAVEKYRGIPPYAETRSYVEKIISIYKKATHPYQSGIVEPSPVLARIKRTQS